MNIFSQVPVDSWNMDISTIISSLATIRFKSNVPEVTQINQMIWYCKGVSRIIFRVRRPYSA